MSLRLLLLSLLTFMGGALAAPLDGITFAAEPGKLYLPVHEAARELGLVTGLDEAGHVVTLGGVEFKPGTLRQLVDGTELVHVQQLADAGVEVAAPDASGAVRVGGLFRGFLVRAGEQRVEVSLAKQQLRGWQGSRLVLQTRISSGRNGRTPAGEFKAGPYRARMHRSSRYNNAPMPWSVQFNGHVFIHGFTSVPNYPASHGCIRVPLNEGNPAKFFYEWVLNGTPIKVTQE